MAAIRSASASASSFVVGAASWLAVRTLIIVASATPSISASASWNANASAMNLGFTSRSPEKTPTTIMSPVPKVSRISALRKRTGASAASMFSGSVSMEIRTNAAAKTTVSRTATSTTRFGRSIERFTRATETLATKPVGWWWCCTPWGEGGRSSVADR